MPAPGPSGCPRSLIESNTVDHWISVDQGTHNLTAVDYANYEVTHPLGDYDWGDAPSDVGRRYFYPTLRSANGARPRMDPRFCLGQRIDADDDGQWKQPDERVGSWLLTVPPGVSTWPWAMTTAATMMRMA